MRKTIFIILGAILMAFLMVPNANAVLVEFQLHKNGVTVTCEGAQNGYTDTVEGKTYTAVDKITLQTMLGNEEDVSQVCTSLIDDMSFLFYNVWGYFTDDISSWDVSNVTNMDNMFTSISFNGDISNWDVSSVKSMYQMFSSSIFSGDISSWDVSNVTNMSQMFSDAQYFNSTISYWDVANVTDMDEMFYGASAFNQDLSSWCVESFGSEPNDFSDYSGMGSGNKPNWGAPCLIYLADNGVTIKCEDANAGDKAGLKGKMITVVADKDEIATILANDGDLSQVCTSKVTTMSQLFSNANDFNQDISSWDVSNVNSMSSMFNKAEDFNQDISSWDVSNVESMSSMFEEAEVFNQDIGIWDVSNVTNMSTMFYKARGFNQDIGLWDVSNVTHMNQMFRYASTFNQDLTNWCVENIAEKPQLFNGNSTLIEDNLPNWSTCPTQHKVGKEGDNEGWRMLASPSTDTYQHFLSKVWTQGATGAKYSGLDAPSNIVVHDITTETYASVTDLTTDIVAGSGFLVYMYESDDYKSEGTFPKRLKITKSKLNNQEANYDLSELLDDNKLKWALLGNPYDAPIYWDNVGRVGVYNMVYVYDGSKQDYLAYNGVYGLEPLNEGKIDAYTGFWVVTNQASTTREVKITTGSRDLPAGKVANQSAFFKLTAEMGDMSDQTLFTFTEDGALNGDGRDALKLEPLDFHSHLSMGTVVGGETMSINNLPLEFDAEAEYALSINALKASENGYQLQSGEVTLKAEGFKNLPESWDVFVNNYNTGERVNLREVESYSFMHSPKQKVMVSTAPRSILTPPAPTPSKAKIAEDSGLTISITASNTPTTNEIEDVPAVFALQQNYPNPFNPTTTIKYSVAKAGHVNLTIYNVMGQKVAELVNTTKTAGAHIVQWDAGTAASGMYFYKLKSGGQTLTKQMMLIK